MHKRPSTSPHGKLVAFTITAILAVVFIVPANADNFFHDSSTTTYVDPQQYVGSDSCAPCHQEKYFDWSKKHMSHFVRQKKDISEHLPIDEPHSPIPKEKVFLVIGSINKLAFVDRYWTVFPYLYHRHKAKWIERNAWHNKDYRSACGSCHMVGLDPRTKHFAEHNVGCEACHGPGRKHAKDATTYKMKVPGKTDGRDVLYTCRRCHDNRGRHAHAIRTFQGKFHGADK